MAAQGAQQMGVAASAQGQDIDAALERYRAPLVAGLRAVVEGARRQTPPGGAAEALLAEFQGQMEYPLGWREPDLSPARAHPGKLLRPALLLLACELAAGRRGARAAEAAEMARRAVPAGVCVELVHNFSLVHDDIEDGDEHRRFRPTLWKVWGVPQAINTGDGMFALARLALWRLLDDGIAAEVVARLAKLVDRTSLELCEGQFLDMRFEGRQDITIAMYFAMIERKTAALMGCAAEMGARLGAPGDETLAADLARFGRALGLGFQLRDDLLGIWAAEDLGKSAAGDLRRKKMSLPVIHALETAARTDREKLAAMYAEPGPATDAQIADALAVLERAGSRGRVLKALAAEGTRAREALAAAAGEAAGASEARRLLDTFVAFVALGT